MAIANGMPCFHCETAPARPLTARQPARRWTDAERSALKCLSVREAVCRLGRSPASIHEQRRYLGLTGRRRADRHDARIQELHAKGWTDQRIGLSVGLGREAVRLRRVALGLAANTHAPEARRWLADCCRRAARQQGWESLTQARLVQESIQAARDGWPAGCHRRTADALAVLYSCDVTLAEFAARYGATRRRAQFVLYGLRRVGWAVARWRTGRGRTRRGYRYRVWSLADAVRRRREAVLAGAA